MIYKKYLFVPLVLFLMACSEQNQPEAQSKISVDPINKNGLQALISNRNGKVLLLNIWATWCIPCREEFSDLVKLSKTFQNGDVEIVGISADYSDEIYSKIIPFLQSQKVNFKNFVQNFPDDSGLINQLSSEWNGALPATFIYNKSGEQKVFLTGKRSFEEFKREIENVKNMN